MLFFEVSEYFNHFGVSRVFCYLQVMVRYFGHFGDFIKIGGGGGVLVILEVLQVYGVFGSFLIIQRGSFG